jgi:hypothetical protein
MVSAIGVRMEFRASSPLGAIISRVYREQLGALQQHLPGSSPQVQSDVALGIAMGAIRALLANDPNSEAGREACELLRLLADHSPAPPNDFKQWAAQHLPDLSGDGIFSPLGSASQFLFEGMHLREVFTSSDEHRIHKPNTNYGE